MKQSDDDKLWKEGKHPIQILQAKQAAGTITPEERKELDGLLRKARAKRLQWVLDQRGKPVPNTDEIDKLTEKLKPKRKSNEQNKATPNSPIIKDILRNLKRRGPRG